MFPWSFGEGGRKEGGTCGTEQVSPSPPPPHPRRCQVCEGRRRQVRTYLSSSVRPIVTNYGSELLRGTGTEVSGFISAAGLKPLSLGVKEPTGPSRGKKKVSLLVPEVLQLPGTFFNSRCDPSQFLLGPNFYRVSSDTNEVLLWFRSDCLRASCHLGSAC